MSILAFTPHKTGRKKLAQLLADRLGVKATYLGTPSFAYQIGDATLDRDWTLHLPAAVGVTVRQLRPPHARAVTAKRRCPHGHLRLTTSCTTSCTDPSAASAHPSGDEHADTPSHQPRHQQHQKRHRRQPPRRHHPWTQQRHPQHAQAQHPTGRNGAAQPTQQPTTPHQTQPTTTRQPHHQAWNPSR